MLLSYLSKNKNMIIIFTADHGKTQVNKDIILDLKKYDKYFYVYPSIDFGIASCYVKEEYREKFEIEFNKRF